MEDSRTFRRALRAIFSSDLAVLILLGLLWAALFIPINAGYGFHRDELNFVDNARHLDWGFVEYPPLTPAIGSIALALFGPSLAGLRLFASLAIAVVFVLVGLITRELGGARPAQILAAFAAVSAPIALSHAAFFSYETFDYLWWVLITYFFVRLMKTGDPRWWLGIGAAIGLGMMTKYTMIFWVIGLAAGVLLTPARRFLKSPWLWAGAGIAVLIFLPNMLWQVRHNFISLDFLTSIHARDVRIGRTNTLQFLLSQFYICASGAAIFLWLGGLRFYLFSPQGRLYRGLGWVYLVLLGLFLLVQGRFYYLAPAYPALIAAGVAGIGRKEVSTVSVDPPVRRKPWITLIALLSATALFNAAATLPIAPIGSGLFKFSSSMNTELREEIGWPELVKTVAGIYAGLPAAERAQAGILAGNYGEAGAVNLYGPAYGLPGAISGVDTYWLRGYGSPPPRVVIVLGFPLSFLEENFQSCTQAAETPNPYHVVNEETRDHPAIYLCRDPRLEWQAIWKKLRGFG